MRKQRTGFGARAILCGVAVLAAQGAPAVTYRATGAGSADGAAAPARSESRTRPPRPAETLFYMRNNDEAIRSFAANARRISIIGPQTFSADAAGNVRGAIDPRIAQIARDNGVRLMPLILNPGFDQPTIHALLDDPAARARVVDRMVELAVAEDYWGWQFDFENIHESYRERMSVFYREAAEALHAAGKTISIAVVPTDGSPGDDDFSVYMQQNWRNSFDVAALAEIGDFVSWMTYAQHAGGTTPGPVAGLPWMREMMDAVLALGVDPAKVSLGIPSYSDYWLPTHSDTSGAPAFADATSRSPAPTSSPQPSAPSGSGCPRKAFTTPSAAAT